MIQTTLLNYFNCNNKDPLKETERIESSTLLKQSRLYDYFTIRRPPNQSTIVDYFTKKKEPIKKKKEPVFDLILIDISKSSAYSEEIQCVKKNLYDKDLKYIALSYRRGEVQEQLVETPSYHTSVSSFDLFHLRDLCNCIRREPDLKTIQYLWIDAISLPPQHITAMKRKTLQHLTFIYQKATYILAVPDLHLKYLLNNPSNRYFIQLVELYRHKIYQQLLFGNDQQQQQRQNNTIKNKDKDDEDNQLKKAYEFLQYLIEDWSTRVWVTNEYHHAKEKIDTPMKYIFIMMLDYNTTSFFNYSFNNQQQLMKTTKRISNHYGQQFIHHLKKKLIQRHPLDMILNTNTVNNEDRFYAFLPLWDKYKHVIQHQDTISTWHITDMISVRLKLYDIMDDLWDKARLLYACSMNETLTLPSFASQYQAEHLPILELDHPEMAHKRYSDFLLTHLLNLLVDHHTLDICIINEEYNQVLRMKSGLYMENLLAIQYHSSLYYLSVKAKKYFIYKLPLHLNTSFLSKCALENNNNLSLVYIPYYIYSKPNYFNIIPNDATGITLVGHSDINRWVLCDIHVYQPNDYTPSSNRYTFHIY